MDTKDEINTTNNTTEVTEQVSCMTSISLFHGGFLLLFGSLLLGMYRVATDFDTSISNGRCKFCCSYCNVAIPILFIWVTYMFLWIYLHPPSLPECSVSCYLNYLLIVENIFLTFGIILTFGELPQRTNFSALRVALAMSIVIGIAFYWTKAQMDTRKKTVMISSVQSSLYIFTVFAAQMTPISRYFASFKCQSDHLAKRQMRRLCQFALNYLCRGTRHRRVVSSESWEAKTHYLRDERRLKPRSDVPHLPDNPDEPLSATYY